MIKSIANASSAGDVVHTSTPQADILGARGLKVWQKMFELIERIPDVAEFEKFREYIHQIQCEPEVGSANEYRMLKDFC